MRLTIAEREINIQPVKVRDLPAFLAAVEPVARELAAGDVLAALARHTDRVITAAAIGAGVERAWLEEQDADALVEIVAAVIEVNADFFARRVGPAIEQAASRIGRVMSNPSSTAGSSPSAEPGSATTT